MYGDVASGRVGGHDVLTRHRGLNRVMTAHCPSGVHWHGISSTWQAYVVCAPRKAAQEPTRTVRFGFFTHPIEVRIPCSTSGREHKFGW